MRLHQGLAIAPAINRFVYQFRGAIEPLWTPETAGHAGLFDEDTEVPVSAGQCGVTHAIMLPELRKEFVDEVFVFTVGRVRFASGATAIAHHAWVDWRQEPGRAPQELDATADQSRVPNLLVAVGGKSMAQRLAMLRERWQQQNFRYEPL